MQETVAIPPSSNTRLDFEPLVQGIRAGDGAAAGRLRELLYPGVRFLVARFADADVEEISGAALGDLIETIERGEITKAESVPGRLRSIIQERVRGRRRPERGETGVDIMRRSLAGLPEQERDALVRYYVLGQEEAQILVEMRLTAAQFRALKLSAKRRLTAQ
ncbi:MAG: hypothetical protein ACM336_21460 [Acidobacteriota bacterium]